MEWIEIKVENDIPDGMILFVVDSIDTEYIPKYGSFEGDYYEEFGTNERFP